MRGPVATNGSSSAKRTKGLDQHSPQHQERRDLGDRGDGCEQHAIAGERPIGLARGRDDDEHEGDNGDELAVGGQPVDRRVADDIRALRVSSAHGDDLCLLTTKKRPPATTNVARTPTVPAIPVDMRPSSTPRVP